MSPFVGIDLGTTHSAVATREEKREMTTAIESASTPKTIATPQESPPEVGELRFVIHNVSWERYEALLELFGDDGPRMNYCRGELELMSPLFPHERYKNLIDYMIIALTDELEIERNSMG
jgi:Uma2 family endonuclease